MTPETNPLPSPRKGDAPEHALQAGGGLVRHSVSGGGLPRPPDPRLTGEAYTRMPDFSKRAAPRWAYFAAAALALMLALSLAWFMRPSGRSGEVRSEAPAAAQSGAAGGAGQ